MDKKLKYTIGIVCLGSLVVMLWLWVLGVLKEAPDGTAMFLFGFLALIFLVEPKKQE